MANENVGLPDVSEDVQRQAILDRSREGFDEFFEGQRQQEDTAVGRFRDVLSSQELPGDAFARLRNEAGLPELEGQISTFKGEIGRVEDLLDRLDEDITERTQGSLTTEAQRRRQISAEGEPLTKNLARLGTAEGRLLEAAGQKERLIGQQLGFLQQGQERELEPVRLQIGMLSDRLARETTGFSTQQQTELDVLIDKLERQRQLSDREWDRVNNLALLEKDYSFQREQSERSFNQQIELTRLADSLKGGSGSGGGSGLLTLSNGQQVTAEQVEQMISGGGISLDQALEDFVRIPETFRGSNTGRARIFPGQTATAGF